MPRVAFAAISLLLLSAAANTQTATGNTNGSGYQLAPAHVITASAPKAASKPAQPAPVYVTVQDGDTLDAIAQANNTTWNRLYAANTFIADPNVIHVGDQIRIPRDDETLPDRQPPAGTTVVSSAPAATTASTSIRTATVSVAVGGDAKAFIYSRESGNNPDSTSASGCYGLGQDCSGTVRAQCGDDYACQDAYFTNYANSRYGGWDGAAAFWSSHGWW